MTKLIERKNIFGIRRIVPSSFNDALASGENSADAIWQEFIPTVIEAGLSPQRVMYGVSWPADELTPPQHVHYFAGFELGEDESVTDGFEELEVEGGNYFTYIYVGSMKSVDAGFLNAYNVAFPDSGLTPREGQHLEIYPADYDPSAEVTTFQILIPVQ